MTEQKTTTPSKIADHPPATDEAIAAYKRGVESGTMKNATPNVVASLIARIEQDATAIGSAPERPVRPDPGHLAGVGQAESSWHRRGP